LSGIQKEVQMTTTIEQDNILTCYGMPKDFSILSYDNKIFYSWEYINMSKKDLINKYSIEKIENLYYEQFDDLYMFEL
jgi:hypothetical protein